MDEMGSEESFQEVPAIQVPMTSEEKLLRRLSEVDRFVVNITAELNKSKPCEGVISRELMERELGALNRDRESIENKLGLLLSSFAVTPKDGSYSYKHGNSPPDIAPGMNAEPPSSARMDKTPQRAKERHPPSVACSWASDSNGGNLDRLSRKKNSAAPGHALNAPPSSSYRGEPQRPHDGRGGRQGFLTGGSRARPFSSVLGGGDQHSDSIRQGGGRRENVPSVGADVHFNADQRQQQHHHPDEQRPGQGRWAVIGGRARGREHPQYHAEVGDAIQPVGANPPPGRFFDRDCNRGGFFQGTPDGVLRAGRRRGPQMPERGASRTRTRQGQGGAGSSSSNGGREGLFRAPSIASSIRPNHRQKYAPPAHDPPLPTRSAPLRVAPHQFEGDSFHHGNRDREGLAREREGQLKRRSFRQCDEPSAATSSRSWRAAPPTWSVEEVGSQAGTRAAFGSARVSVPIAMTVDNHHIDGPRTDSHQSDYGQHNLNTHHMGSSRVFGDHRAGPSDHPDAKHFTNSNRRYVDINNDYNWSYDNNGNRAGDTNIRADNLAYCDNNHHVDSQSRETSRRLNVESRSWKRGRWCRQGQEPVREQRSVQKGTRGYPHSLESRVTASSESSGWGHGKLGAYSLTAQSPTH